jgi:ribonuclease J
VTVVLDAKGRLAAEPQVSVVGLLDEHEEEPLTAVRAEVHAALATLNDRQKADDDTVREAVRLAVRRSFRKTVGKKPVTQIHLVRL